MAIGTEYFADLLDSSATPPTRWRATTPAAIVSCAGGRNGPDLPLDEWIDDIPFPETQNYVKRILGTAEDYRRLYGGGLLSPVSTGTASSPPAPPAAVAPSSPPAKAPAVKAPAKKRSTPARRPAPRPRPPGL